MLSYSMQQMLPQIRGYLSGQPISKAWLFGSYSRGEETADSDIDLLVEYTDSDSISLFAISRMATALRKLTGKTVDLVERSRLLPFASKNAEQDKILIYERKN
ncbi:MAG: nucleotidyltransferase domain-containing protein [Bacteroidaceae bacterium]|nr:nucleotidyltransferase domain-containing protein [Bacteroidaceae bacterium]